MPRITGVSTNLRAFLDMIAVSEGTAGKGDDGYNIICGGGTFESYADHPRKLVNFPKLKIKSTAAGRYQVLSKYFDAYKKQLKLADFSPVAQDSIAIQQIAECRALSNIADGDFEVAVKKCAHIWASLPGAGYGQHEHKIEFLQAAYVKSGGTLA